MRSWFKYQLNLIFQDVLLQNIFNEFCIHKVDNRTNVHYIGFDDFTQNRSINFF